MATEPFLTGRVHSSPSATVRATPTSQIQLRRDVLAEFLGGKAHQVEDFVQQRVATVLARAG